MKGWSLGQADLNAAVVVKEFIDTFHTQPGFNVKALTDLIAGAIKQAEEAASRTEGIAEISARAAGRVEGIEIAADFISGFASVTENHTEVVARQLEESLHVLSRELEQSVRAALEGF